MNPDLNLLYWGGGVRGAQSYEERKSKCKCKIKQYSNDDKISCVIGDRSLRNPIVTDQYCLLPNSEAGTTDPTPKPISQIKSKEKKIISQ